MFMLLMLLIVKGYASSVQTATSLEEVDTETQDALRAFLKTSEKAQELEGKEDIRSLRSLLKERVGKIEQVLQKMPCLEGSCAFSMEHEKASNKDGSFEKFFVLNSEDLPVQVSIYSRLAFPEYITSILTKLEKNASFFAKTLSLILYAEFAVMYPRHYDGSTEYPSKIIEPQNQMISNISLSHFFSNMQSLFDYDEVDDEEEVSVGANDDEDVADYEFLEQFGFSEDDDV